MFDELHASFARVRIAALQSEIFSRADPSSTVVIRRRNSKVTPVVTQDGDIKLARRKVVRAKREHDVV